jgi:hypothetical protein
MAEFFLGEPSEAPSSLKRRASSTFESRGDNSRKRLKEDLPPNETTDPQAPALISGSLLADDLEQELLCGCCSALLYRPVIVYPCQHYFCGSCCQLWVRVSFYPKFSVASKSPYARVWCHREMTGCTLLQISGLPSPSSVHSY